MRGSNSGTGSFIPGKDPLPPYCIAAGLVGPTSDPDAFDYVTLLVIIGWNQFLTWCIKHGRVSSPFSVVKKGRNYKPFLCESSQWSYHLTTKPKFGTASAATCFNRLCKLFTAIRTNPHILHIITQRLWTTYELRVYKIYETTMQVTSP